KANLTSANREIFETELEDFKQTIKKSVSSGAIFKNGDSDPGQDESQAGPSTTDGSSKTYRTAVVQTKLTGGSETVPVRPLDPAEVFDSLPENMKQCFLKRDAEELERIAMEMNVKDFQYHLQRCIESGLWIPGDE
uniref:Cdc37 C-terminal domain-containing protein n=1 Tax=Romanomermis culicivorax TaxID=13658 RepID=A0A915JD22_ROMCU